MRLVRDGEETDFAHGATLLKYFSIAMTFGDPTSSSVAQACLLRDDRVVKSNYNKSSAAQPAAVGIGGTTTFRQGVERGGAEGEVDVSGEENGDEVDNPRLLGLLGELQHTVEPVAGVGAPVSAGLTRRDGRPVRPARRRRGSSGDRRGGRSPGGRSL